MPSESDFRRLFRKYLPQVHWATVESRTTESGIPDINGALQGAEFWIECKVVKAFAVNLRPMQMAWILRRVRHGGNVFIAVRKKNSIVDELYLIDGKYVKELNEKGLHEFKCIGGGGPGQWPWAVVASMLCRVPALPRRGRGLPGSSAAGGVAGQGRGALAKSGT